MTALTAACQLDEATGSEGVAEPLAVRLIRARCSCRCYADRPIPAAQLGQLAHVMRTPPPSPFGSKVRLALLPADATDAASDEPVKLGTYGMIRGAKTFLAGAVAASERDLEDFGYLFEWLLLCATSLGLGTCWLGATLRRNRFSDALAAADDELVPAASPLGFTADRRGVVDTVFRWAVRAKRRKPWTALFFDESFDASLAPTEAGQVGLALEMVRLGPSAVNKQPWRVVRKDGQFHFYLRRTRSYKWYFEVDLQRLDMGVALCHFEATVRSLGLAGGWVVRDPEIALPPRTSYLCSWAPA